MKFKAEPVLWMAFVRSAILVTTTFGLSLSMEQIVAIQGLAEAAIALFTRSQVSPT
jgi:hypothetical protein